MTLPRKLAALLPLFVVLAAADPAAAYMGPGAGLTLIGTLVAVVAAVLLVLAGLIILPIRLALKRARANKAAEAADLDAG